MLKLVPVVLMLELILLIVNAQLENMIMVKKIQSVTNVILNVALVLELLIIVMFVMVID